VGDELVAGAAQLVGVAITGEVEGPRQGRAVDGCDRERGGAIAPRVALGRRVELLDNGKEVREEALLL
jgi:hypothetical protein